jgi:predicted MPP superfamily phosphohydrolase
MTFVLAALGCFGHLILMIGSHNWFYGLRHPKWLGDVLHLMHAVFVLALPVGLILGWGWSLEGLITWPPSCAFHAAVLAYLAVCWLVALAWLPGITVWRAVRKQPRGEARREIVDVRRQLGQPLIGDGHHAFLGRLPGNQIFSVEYVERTLHPTRLPAALDGLTILHLTDLHFHGTPSREYYEAILERCAAWRPDVVCVTGDVADSATHHEWIAPLLGELTWKEAAVAILGNHDHRHDVEVIRGELRKLGMLVPENTWHEVTVRGEKVIVVGHEGPWLAGGVDLEGCPDGPFRLCLSHTPDNARWACRNGMDLVLSGHVHGGQIRLPPFGSILLPSRCGRRYDGGAYLLGETLLYVSRGLSGEHPVRYNCRPEVTLLTLRKG